MKAPFPWFGGKSKVAPQVWQALGRVDHYVEPFAGSLAVLLGRPLPFDGRETVNDKDAYLANFWRATAEDPESVAYYADWPVNETDLYARHRWLVETGRERLLKLEDPDYYDAKVAGWWVWGLCQWIGSGWCQGAYKKRPSVGRGNGVYRQLPHCSDNGRGVHRKRPECSGSNSGKGTHRTGMENGFRDYFLALQDRLRRVRVCCGEWDRILTDGVLCNDRTTGIFLDPPYDESIRDNGCYNTDGNGQEHLSSEVRKWAVEHGDNPKLRIVLAGYFEEHDREIPPAWRRERWKSGGCYQTAESSKRDDGNQANRKKECLWFSPHCLNPQPLLI